MKKLAAALLAAAVSVPMLSYAQSPAPSKSADGATSNAKSGQSAHSYENLQSGWATQPSPQALGQSVYTHR
ncbi:hypothetical protein AWB77_01660 [Caballeronia fortuita]|uniref:Lipoprotein n=1 Tax=Caballeronia fortuita TaxID=1777138 RepID=A0A158ADP7_9BURK|nr:hypothetical protein [Caballeronia fortuita]SAK55839.1 hypothetical protein AWB77_01660 [Caballeronia fortuita]